MPAYTMGLVVPDATEIEEATGRLIAAVRSSEYQPDSHISMEAIDASGEVIATFIVAYGDTIASATVPGGRLTVQVDAGDATGSLAALAALAEEHAGRLHEANYEAPPLPENLEAGLFVIQAVAHDLQRWLDAIEASDGSAATSAEAAVQTGCNAGRTFETARWLFTAAPCLDAARASWLIHEGDTEAAARTLRDALATLGEIIAAFAAAMQE